MENIFTRNVNAYSDNASANTRCKSFFYNHVNPKQVNYGLETLRSLGPKIWSIIPKELKSDTIPLSAFKIKIKK